MPVRPCAGCFTRLISLSHWIITYLINQNYFLPHFTDKNIEVERWQVTYLISYSQWILRWEGSPDNKAAEPEVRRAVSHSPGWLTLTQRQKGRAGVHSTHAEGQEEPTQTEGREKGSETGRRAVNQTGDGRSQSQGTKQEHREYWEQGTDPEGAAGTPTVRAPRATLRTRASILNARKRHKMLSLLLSALEGKNIYSQ